MDHEHHEHKENQTKQVKKSYIKKAKAAEPVEEHPISKEMNERTNHEHMNNEHMNHDHMNHEHMNHEHMNEGDHAGHGNHHEMMVKDFKRRFYISLIITIPILILSPMIQMFLNVHWRFSGDSYLLFGLSTILLIYGGKPFFTGAVDELRRRSPAMMMLITLALLVSYIYSALTVFGLPGNDFFWELSTLIVIMLLGHWIEMKSAMGASKALESLISLMPKVAHRLNQQGDITDIPVTDLKVNDRILVKPGENIPIDGVVFEGKSSVNESILTGESMPVEKTIHDDVIGGSINGEGILKFTVSKTGDETFLSQVVKLVRDAQSSRSKTQRLADVAAKWLFYIAVAAGVITYVAWIASGQTMAFALERTVTVVIISCPHALGVAIPLVTSVSTSIAAKRVLLIKDRAAFEGARKINAVVFDKTGTLTLGEFGVNEVIALSGSKEDLLSIVYSLEVNSEHPLAKGIVSEAKTHNAKRLEVKDYQTVPGVGLVGSIGNKNYMIVSPNYLAKEKIIYDKTKFNHLTKQGNTVVFVLQDNELIGAIALSDTIRESAKDAIHDLNEMKITSVMLTGDNRVVATQVGSKLGIEKVIAEVLPKEKVHQIEKLKQEGYVVAMTGDGVNDAPALAKADLGIAIGAGTDVAIETADVILVRSDPRDVVSIIQLAKATYRKMIQNLIWATAYNVVALPLAAGIFYYQGIVVSPALGAVLMSLSAIIVSINAKLLRIK